MPKTIWKFPVTFDGPIVLPADAQVLSVQMQHGIPTMWAIVDPDTATRYNRATKRLHIAGTGHELPDNLGRFIDTFQMEDGTLVFHVFELS